MKFFTTVLPLAAITTAFVLPDEQVMEQIAIEKQPESYIDQLKGSVDDVWSGVEDTFKDVVAFGGNAFDNAINAATEVSKDAAAKFQCHHSMTAFDTQGWLDSAVETVDDLDLEEIFDHPHKKPHKRPKHPHHGHHPHHKPNLTVYQLIAGSKYTTKLAKLIDEFPDLVEYLNGTAANYTVFAPTDKAFEKIPDHGKKPSKELIRKVLAYHVSADFYPAGRVLVSHTIPTALGEDALGGEAQRLRVGLGLGGLRVNFYSKVVAVNIVRPLHTLHYVVLPFVFQFGTNGVIHGVDSLLLPPPPASKILELLPGEFSTLDYALSKTGLDKVIADGPHAGGTIFAPSNWAFKKLGPKINAFLFSSYGEKYLAALLKYHVVANQTLYSDAFYKAKDSEAEAMDEVDSEGIPKGRFHVDLPTLLDDKSLSIDVARWGGFISIKINGFNSVAVQDGIAKDGVIHVVSSLLIPPKTPGGLQWAGEEMTVEEFKDRFDPYVEEL
ncbi:Aurofusarin biosynthesis cluster S [Hyphodiscus hymeniophilus]|uniref:Aurofusarin biosynthesis cluster S n=1 Tax=Hyphodiscus hymeniophilus TaxID=353542 RepID=A0A9P6VPY2_9HELO|nr:Aurofusarin biosynthesis cluster S [Hyphodiscus hymeniophilus]